MGNDGNRVSVGGQDLQMEAHADGGVRGARRGQFEVAPPVLRVVRTRIPKWEKAG